MSELLPKSQRRYSNDFESARRHMQEELSTLNPKSIWLACSGGLDSMVLGHTLRSLRTAEVRWQLGLLHVNYRLRGEESDADAAFVASWAQTHGLSCRILTIDPAEHPHGMRGVQEWARERRYRWFETQCASGSVLALAHHADDLVETVLMRLARGAHLGQLQGMDAWNQEQGVWRPFLGLSRQALEAEAQRQKIPHREDSSNAKLIYSRNRVRHILLPELEAMYPGVRESLLQLAAEARDFVAYSEAAGESGESLSAQSLKGLSETVARQKISAFVGLKCGDRRLSRRVLELLHRALEGGQSLQLDLSERQHALVQAGSLQIRASERRPSVRWSQYEKGLTDAHPRAWLSSGAVFEPLT